MKHLLTPAQTAALAPYEEQMRQASRSSYIRHVPKRQELEGIQATLRDAGVILPLNPGCGQCVLRLFQTAGALYEATKSAALEAANDQAAVQATIEDAAKPADAGQKQAESAPSKPKTAPKSTKTTKAAKSTK